VRYLMSFGAAALAVPLIVLTQKAGGFPTLFAVLAAISTTVLAGALAFPRADPGATAAAGPIADLPPSGSSRGAVDRGSLPDAAAAGSRAVATDLVGERRIGQRSR
jgi:hypothetical protein